ncbi:L,D-transpeptidase [Pimelobacter sp. 30-1]|uniref:L,D-transpeptidase n=1 Tax=Pimelobacter sp. 30-1 TaxID=2004991 RepID=UPI001C04DE7C|nr:L,D-transpeptidase [Pimelobacter sp. 30-1]
MSQPPGRRRAEPPAGRRRAEPPGRRRAEPPGRRRAAEPTGRRRAAEPAGRRRAAEVRPRYGRITAFGAALAVTSVAVAGGFGLLPSDPDGSRGIDATGASSAIAPSVDRQGDQEPARSDGRRTTTTPGLLDAAGGEIAALSGTSALPAGSGTGRRIVFSEGRQRVWLIDGAGKVIRTYLVSGSVTDNLKPGTYAVYSRSRNAIGIDDSGTMEYFVRFTQGTQGAAIGFHTIPVDDGKPVQTVAQLGSPRSHGCIRQERTNAIALWDFAPIGTTVVVTA